MRTCVIVPAFNEAKSLPSVIAELHQAAPHVGLCVVDDGSSDATAQVAEQCGAMVLRCPRNLGVGGAMRLGYLWAQEQDYDAAVQLDGDGQHRARFIAALLAPIRNAEAALVIGSRFLARSGFQSTPLRRAGIRLLSWLLRVRSGARVTDPTSGFRAANRAAIALFARSYPRGYPEPESIALAVSNGLRVCEVPVEMAQRTHGESSINSWRALYYAVKVPLALLFSPLRAQATEKP